MPKSNILCPVCKRIIDVVEHDSPDGPSPYYSARPARDNHLRTTSCDSFEDWKIGYLVEPVKPELQIIDRYAELNEMQRRDLAKLAHTLGEDIRAQRPHLIKQILIKEFDLQ